MQNNEKLIKKPISNDQAILGLIQHMMGDKTFYKVEDIVLEMSQNENGSITEYVKFQYIDKYWLGRRDEANYWQDGSIPLEIVEEYITENDLLEYCYDDWRNGGHYQEVGKTPMQDYLQDTDCLTEAVTKYMNEGGRVW